MSENAKTPHHFLIEPLVGVGPVRLGLHKDDVSDIFPYMYRSFFRSPESKVRSDLCESVGLIVHYDDYRRVKLIEAFQPKGEAAAVTLELFGRDVTRVTMHEAIALISLHGPMAEETHGFVFHDLGITVVKPKIASENDYLGHFAVGPALPFDPFSTRMG